MSTQLAIETAKLEKTYRNGQDQAVQAVAGVSLAIYGGEIYALLGPNGAGKSTLLAILTTLLEPTGGSGRVAGFDVVAEPARVRRRIGVTFQEVVLDSELTGRQVLDFHGQLYGMRRNERRARIAELGALVELSDAFDRPVGSYSGGMKRRLELARGLLTDPSILFLDEPTQGLDPQNRASIWRYIRQLRAERGTTVLLTTHYMDEAAALADRVGILDHGRLAVEGPPADLVRQMGSDVISVLGGGDAAAFAAAARGLAFVQASTWHDQESGETLAQIGVDAGERRLAEIVNLATSTGFHIHEISVAKPSLGDVFLAHTGHALRDV